MKTIYLSSFSVTTLLHNDVIKICTLNTALILFVNHEVTHWFILTEICNDDAKEKCNKMISEREQFHKMMTNVVVFFYVGKFL